MSYPELMQHAQAIRETAVEMEVREMAEVYGQAGVTSPVDREGIEQKYAFIDSLFEPFSQLPDPAAYDPLIDELRAATELVSAERQEANELNQESVAGNPMLGSMTTAGDYLASWSGSAAMKFKEDFIDTFPAISGNQVLLLSAMRRSLAAHKEMWEATRKDIDAIAHKTLDALDNAGGSGKNGWTFGFSLLGAAAAIVGVTIATGGVGVVVAAAGAVASAGGAAVAGVDSISASGDWPEEIVNSMKQAVERLTQDIRDTEARIEEGLHQTTGGVTGRRDLFAAARPALADLTGGELTGDGGMGRSS